MSKAFREYTTKNGESLVIAMGDITREQVGVIVNAANEDLWLGAGVAGAIDRAGGPIIQKECYDYTRKHGSVPTGGCAYTSGGRMHAKYVIHAVGPIWKNGKSGEVEALQSCVTGSINMTNTTLKQDSLSIPAISSGIFGFPKDLCARLMIEAALEYFKTSESTEKNLKMIRLCNFDKPTVTYFVTAFDKIFGTSDQKPQISQAEIEPQAPQQEDAQADQMQDSQQTE